MDEITECISKEELMALVDTIGMTLNGHSGGACILALCHCLSVVINKTDAPMEFVTQLLTKYVEIGESDETAH